jgi:hypothetical protein
VAGILTRIPVVAGVAYRERVQSLPSTFTATLSLEPENRYFPHAIAVLAGGEKIGYVAPEIAPGYYDAVKISPSPITCPARRSSQIDHEQSGVDILLDFSDILLPAVPSGGERAHGHASWPGWTPSALDKPTL